MTKYVAGLLSLLTIVSVSAFAHAASAADLSVGASASVKADALSRIITRGDAAISRRIDSLNALSTRIEGWKNASETEKSSLSAQVQAQISSLTALKAKIDAGTDATATRNDERSIYGSYRIYALIIPQGYIVASADRIVTIAGMMTSVTATLQAKVTAAQDGGKDVAALQSSLTDANAKIADAGVQAQAAQSAVASLAPDDGSASVAASNKAAITSARAKIKVATDDLKAARGDIQSVIKGLKALGAY